MSRFAFRYLVIALIAVLAAIAGLWIARSLPVGHHADEGRLHTLMHEQLDLDEVQEQQIDVLEAQFRQRRAALNQELRKSNAELARAIASEHGYGPAVEQAVDKSHTAMGELQKATLSHVFAMRAVLRPDQARIFDEAIAATLTETPQE
ncbi:Spy/CpxP family protein refolding chaperone [Altererythrobacter sp.]|uniref:Spy/CpxP family protein refolding chaperone n=1 Tax=Altererythrobacter sp. TaxID=1872480 RepID=UPI003D077AD1